MTSSPFAYSSFIHLLIFSPPLISSSEVKLLLLRPLHCQRELLKMGELYSLSLVYYSIVQIRVSLANCNFHLEIYAQAELKSRQVVFVVCITTSSWRRPIRKQWTPYIWACPVSAQATTTACISFSHADFRDSEGNHMICRHTGCVVPTTAFWNWRRQLSSACGCIMAMTLNCMATDWQFCKDSGGCTSSKLYKRGWSISPLLSKTLA